MPKAKYQFIYKSIKQKIISQEYHYQELLPSEHKMVSMYDCSRNTIRRALSVLSEEGYIQAVHGIGVRVIYLPMEQNTFTIGGIESFRESALRNHKNPDTKIIQFAVIIADERIANKTGFLIGSELYYIQRVRYLDEKALILDINMFQCSLVPNLTKEIAKASIYDYIENTVGMQIVTSKRKMTVERTTEIDEKYLEIGDYNCVAVLASQTYNADGVIFEYTESRHQPDYFCFQDTAIRKK